MQLSIIVFLLFTAPIHAAIKIICVDKAPIGSPVTISYEGISEGAAVKIIKEGFSSSDTFLELFDANGKPVTLFWSLEPGPRTIELITCSHNDNGIEVAKHTLNYGNAPLPTPDEPDNITKLAVTPVTSYIVANKIAESDLKLLSEFYSDFSKELLKSSVKDTGAFRTAYIEAGKKFFQGTGIDNKYSGLSDIIDKILADQLTLQIVPLDKVKTAKLLHGISWAFAKGVK